MLVLPPTANFHTKIFSCPECKSVLKSISHFPSFGPAKVQCAGCNTVLTTNFVDWATLSLSRKLWATLFEFCAPAFWSLPKVIIYVKLFICGVAGSFFSALPMLGMIILFGCVIAGGLYVRSQILVAEDFSHTQIPPKWGKGFTYKVCKNCGHLNRSDRVLCEKCLKTLRVGSWENVFIYALGGLLFILAETRYSLYGIPWAFAIIGLGALVSGLWLAYKLWRANIE